MRFDQIYRAFLRDRGFPSSPQVATWWKNEAGAIVGRNARSENGAIREAHIRDCAKMAACLRNSRNDFLPCMMVEHGEIIEGAARS